MANQYEVNIGGIDYVVLEYVDVGNDNFHVPATITSIDYLVGGAGGGGCAGQLTVNFGSAGGGGQIKTGSLEVSPEDDISIVVGSKGLGVLTSGTGNGGSSSLGAIVANGGLSAVYNTRYGGTSGSGQPGGYGGGGGSSSDFRGGGGGGAGGAGSTMNGGVGILSSITGTSVGRGGGGGSHANVAGDGTYVHGGARYTTNAADNSCGGGGGGAVAAYGGNGGTGIVIVRYVLPSTISLPNQSIIIF